MKEKVKKYRKPIICGLGILILVLVVAKMIFRFYTRNIAYRDLEVEEVTVSWGGGFGTELETHSYFITFDDSGVYLHTDVYGEDGSSDTLKEFVEVSHEDVDLFYDLIRKNMWSLKNETEEDWQIFDGGSQHVIVNGESFGGYMAHGEGLEAVYYAARNLVGQDAISGFIGDTWTWYEAHEVHIDGDLEEVIIGGPSGEYLEDISESYTISITPDGGHIEALSKLEKKECTLSEDFEVTDEYFTSLYELIDEALLDIIYLADTDGERDLDQMFFITINGDTYWLDPSYWPAQDLYDNVVGSYLYDDSFETLESLYDAYEEFKEEVYADPNFGAFAVSPDGVYALYNTTGVPDDNGYLHYALRYEDDNGDLYYGFAFYSLKNYYTPQIEWYDDGFFVSYYCPEYPERVGDWRAVAIETKEDYLSFRSEDLKDGIYIYYEPVNDHARDVGRTMQEAAALFSGN